MIKAIEMNADDMKEIMKHLPDHIAKKLMQAIKPDSGLEIVKEFVEEYEDDNMGDHIIAHTISNLIRKISQCASEIQKDRKKEKKKGITTMEMGYIVIEMLKSEAENIKNAIEAHDEKCTKGEDCGAKH